MDLPFDGEITRFFEEGVPKDVRTAIEEAGKNDVLGFEYPYATRMDKDNYEDQLEALQVELVKMQDWLDRSDERLVLVFEGRDAAGKGGSISRLTMNLNPRAAHTVALGKPTERERGEWYFQRYVPHLPTTSEMTVFDRSWYNRGVVEKVFGFVDDPSRERFFEQVSDFERLLVRDGIRMWKFWLNVSRAEQLRRILARERDPLKQWKLSRIDVEGLALWDAYTGAIEETLERSHTAHAPWTVIRADDKRRARLAVIRSVLAPLPYDGKDEALVGAPDPAIAGGPDLWVRQTGW
ncbi:polyphosphate kinase 2 [Hasllibacter halocynthiae]|uniref:ADP/GDP-polyphosphate phosphotransferase n=1 Tax=Hasllibacter halocynthiae TaxID=595589 RepID=A0A2T0X8D1_9RHOB|nr:polyphosphate kinase 2 [Hasllibacter halocynthiae]PRY95189.1 polyphosphate kinase 2 [Hasllibacter halocynthiae]